MFAGLQQYNEATSIQVFNLGVSTVMLKPGKYRHFKGQFYEVIGVARHSESDEPFVVYRPLYGEGGLWIRPLAMFDETIERDGRQYKRFEYVAPEA